MSIRADHNAKRDVTFTDNQYVVTIRVTVYNEDLRERLPEL